MAICNIFNEINENNGTFLTFSQYSDDLIKEWVQADSWHIVPSKYVLVNANYNQFDNQSLSRKLQEQFENACACFKSIDSEDESYEYNPNISKDFFWEFMDSNNLLEFDDSNPLNIINIPYVGDINMKSYSEFEGTGYGELYCYIPNEATKCIYQCSKGIYNETIIEKEKDSYLCGYSDGELNGLEKLSTDYIYKHRPYSFSWDDQDPSQPALLTKQDQTSTSFVFNTMVILYDIYKDDEKIYQNIPMGIYFTGGIQDDGTLKNEVIKYISNNDILGAGTAYGLRICTKYIVSPTNKNAVIQNTVSSDNYSELSRVLSSVAETLTKMNEIINKPNDQMQVIKNLLMDFNNSKINVPYIKEVNGQNYWFVNGKLITPSTNEIDTYSNYNENELKTLFQSNL